MEQWLGLAHSASLLADRARRWPILVWFFDSAQHIDQSINKGMPKDFRAEVDLANDFAVFVVLKNALLVPLAQVEILAVEAEV